MSPVRPWVSPGARWLVKVKPYSCVPCPPCRCRHEVVIARDRARERSTAGWAVARSLASARRWLSGVQLHQLTETARSSSSRWRAASTAPTARSRTSLISGAGPRLPRTPVMPGLGAGSVWAFCGELAASGLVALADKGLLRAFDHVRTPYRGRNKPASQKDAQPGSCPATRFRRKLVRSGYPDRPRADASRGGAEDRPPMPEGFGHRAAAT
jgi:hypothetical protein